MRRPKVLSLGGGLDSWAMLLDAEIRGELPDVVAFVDVGDRDDANNIAEWDSTYRHIEEVVQPWCAARGIQFVEISARTGYAIRPHLQNARSLFGYFWQTTTIPVAGNNRICTRIAKVERFEAWLDATYPGQVVETWIGFDAAETERADNDPNAGNPRKPTHLGKLPMWWRWTRVLAYCLSHAQRVNRFPLIERDLCRCRCEALARESGYPVPRKSACQFCVYASKTDWRALAAERPAVFARIVELEERKPPTKENNRKLSIMAYSSRTQKGTPLPKFIASRDRPGKPKPCPVCGAAKRATKATGCGYLDDNAGVAA